MSATSLVPLPTIEKAAKLIADDNGAFNRDCPDPISPVMTLLRSELKADYLAKVEASLAAMTDEQLVTACTGEASDQMALNMDPDAEWILTTIFEEM